VNFVIPLFSLLPSVQFRNWCSRLGLHQHWRRPQRRVSALGLRERKNSTEANKGRKEDLVVSSFASFPSVQS
jgi:hypothetical protein